MKHAKSSRIVAALVMVALAACGAASDTGTTPTEPLVPTIPVTGTAVAGMANVDAAISTLMTQWDIPGGAVGIMKDGRLVYARGLDVPDGRRQRPAAGHRGGDRVASARPLSDLPVMFT